MDQTQTTRYVSRFEPLLYVPVFTQKDFHFDIGPSTKEPPPRNYNFTLGVHYSTLKYNHLYTKRNRHKAKANKRLQHLAITIDHK